MLTDVLAVHLRREWLVALDPELHPVAHVRDVRAGDPAAGAERGSHDGKDASGPHRVDREAVQAVVEPGLRAEPDRPPAQEGERRGVLDDRQEQAVPPFAGSVAPRQLDVRRSAVEAPREEEAQAHQDEVPVADAPLDPRLALDRLDDRCVESESAIRDEVASCRAIGERRRVDTSQVDAPRARFVAPPSGDERCSLLGRFRDAQRSGEHVGPTTWHDGQRRPGADQPVRGFVHGSVPTQHRHQVHAVARCLARELGGVGGALGLRLLHEEAIGEHVDDRVTEGRRDRLRPRIDDEENPRAGQLSPSSSRPARS